MKRHGFFTALLVAVTGCPTNREQRPAPVASSVSSPRPFPLASPPPASAEAPPSLKGFEVERERRTGYRWYGAFASELLDRERPAWRALVRAN